MEICISDKVLQHMLEQHQSEDDTCREARAFLLTLKAAILTPRDRVVVALEI